MRQPEVCAWCRRKKWNPHPRCDAKLADGSVRTPARARTETERRPSATDDYASGIQRMGQAGRDRILRAMNGGR